METIVLQETDPDVLEVLYAALELGGFQVYALSDCDTDFLQVIDRPPACGDAGLPPER
jgi:hypothetical protein